MAFNDLILGGGGDEPDPTALAAHGASMFVDIEFGPAEALKRLAADVVALIDTGASVNCIDDDLARALRLPVIDLAPMGGVGGLHQSNVYLASLHVKSLNARFYEPLHGVHLAAAGLEHRILLGRPFLRHFVLVYDGMRGVVSIADHASRAAVLSTRLA
ncbi:MAG TPA: retropepsin-like aspartic protease [Azospirillaceae bacterium]|nr:retropepsin-like aspartic protease [Azospirillaceae bacterium]